MTSSGTDVMSVDKSTHLHYEHVDFTESINFSYPAPGSSENGIEWAERLSAPAAVQTPGLMRVQRNRILNRILTM